MSMIGDLFVKLGLKSDEYEKGIDRAQRKTQSFGNSIGNIFKQIASSVGLGGIVDQFTSITEGVGEFYSSLKTASVGSTAFSGAMKIVKVALASTGIGAIVVAFGALAAYFGRTREGAEALERGLSGIKAVFNVLIDRASTFGEGMIKMLSGEWAAGWKLLKDSMSGVGSEMKEEGAQAMALQGKLQLLAEKERAVKKENASRRAEAERLRLAATDENKTLDERIGYLNTAMSLEKTAYDKERAIADEKIKINLANSAMSKSLESDLEKQNELEIESIQLKEDQSAALKSYTRQLNALKGQKILDTNEKRLSDLKSSLYAEQEIITQSFASKAISEEQYNLKMLAADRSYLENKLKLYEEIIPTLPASDSNKIKYEAEIPKIKLDIQNIDVNTKTINDTINTSINDALYGSYVFKIDPQIEINNEEIDAAAEKEFSYIQKFNDGLNSLIESGMSNALSTFGEGLGALMTGDMDIGDFGASLIGVVGQFMVQLGQLMVALGIGMTGLKAAISSMNPIVAIGAGVALIAVGSAISSLSKKGLGGSSNGGSSPAASGYSGSQNQSNAAQSLSGNVVFELQGNTLKGVLNNQDRRNQNFR